MKRWIFVVMDRKADGRTYKADEIYRRRMQDRFYGIGERTARKSELARGDSVVFYLGYPAKTLVGTARLSSGLIDLSPDELARLSHGTTVYDSTTGVYLDEIETWDIPRPMNPLVECLEFVQNKENWGAYLQGGIREVSEDDWNNLTTNVPTMISGAIPSHRGIENETEFALESHLEEFIANNWYSIDFAAPLELYQDGEQGGRQFPAGIWSIDFLCKDRESGDFVVIELKRGKPSDSVVGQLLRYLSWIREHLATDGQRVRGIIIAHNVDDALRYSVQDLPDVELLVYKVNFNLSRFRR